MTAPAVQPLTWNLARVFGTDDIEICFAAPPSGDGSSAVIAAQGALLAAINAEVSALAVARGEAKFAVRYRAAREARRAARAALQAALFNYEHPEE